MCGEGLELRVQACLLPLIVSVNIASQHSAVRLVMKSAFDCNTGT